MVADPENAVSETEPETAPRSPDSYAARRDALGMFLYWAQDEADAVFTMCLSWMGSPDMAESVAQASFIRIWSESGKTPRGLSRQEWLIRLTLHECKSAVEEIPEASRQCPVFMPQDAAKLITEDKETLVLHDLVGFSSAQVAKVLEISVGAARSRLNRARRGAAGFILDPAEPIPTEKSDTLAPFFVRNRLSALLDGRLNESAKKELENAISSSAVLKREHTVLLNLVNHLQAISKPAPPGFLERLEESIKKNRGSGGSAWRASASGVWGLVAAGAIVGVVLWGREEPTITRVPMATTIEVPATDTEVVGETAATSSKSSAVDDAALPQTEDQPALEPVDASMKEAGGDISSVQSEDNTPGEESKTSTTNDDTPANEPSTATQTPVAEVQNEKTTEAVTPDVGDNEGNGVATESAENGAGNTETASSSGFVVPSLVGYRMNVVKPETLSYLSDLARNHGGNIEEVGRDNFSARTLDLEDNFARLILSVPTTEHDSVRKTLVALGGMSSDVPISVKSAPEEGKSLFFVEVQYLQ